jgi:hypothetical protein
MQEQIEPVVAWAAAWGLQVGLGVVGTQVFYAVIFKLLQK